MPFYINNGLFKIMPLYLHQLPLYLHQLPLYLHQLPLYLHQLPLLILAKPQHTVRTEPLKSF